MTRSKKTYLPAAGRDWLLPLYDPFVKLLGIGGERKALIDQSKLQPEHRVLDIGCGTGTMIVQIKHLYPDVEITGLDPDPKALRRAKQKMVQWGFSTQLDRGFSDDLPYPDEHFDRVFSSFMFHHLERDQKEKTLCEARRVLKPGGSLHLLDFGHSESSHIHKDSFLFHRIHSSHRMKDNSEEYVLKLMKRTGFTNPKKIRHDTVFFSLARIVWFRASVPSSISK